jgi:hypothetical protein
MSSGAGEVEEVPSEGRNGWILAVARGEPDGRYFYCTALVLHRHMGKESSPRRLFTWLLGFINTDGVSDR